MSANIDESVVPPLLPLIRLLYQHWAPLPVQYADYTLWQYQLLGDPADSDSLVSAQLRYWAETLAGLPEEVLPPTDRPRPAVASYRGGNVLFRLDSRLHQELVTLAQRSGASLFMVLHAGLAALLSRLGAGDDIPIGSPIAGRTDQALNDMVGFFINNLVLRTDVSGNPTFTQLLARVRETTLAAYAHQDVPFELLVEVLNPARVSARNPLFQVVLNLLNVPEFDFGLPGLDVALLAPPPIGVAKFDLTVRLFNFHGIEGIEKAPGGLDGMIEYATDLFDFATIETLAARWVRLLDAVVTDPDQPIGWIDLLTPDERTRLLAHYNNTAAVVSDLCLPALFETQVQAVPDAVAVVSGNTILTYAQLNATANRLAHALITRGVGPERVVALVIPRSVDMVTAVLAVLKAGAAYLLVDADYPPEWVGLVLDDARPALLLTGVQAPGCIPDDGTIPRLMLDDPDTVTGLGQYPETDPTDADRITALRSEHPACVMYACGPKGIPDGVVVCHAGIPSLVAAQGERLGVGAHSRVLQFASPSFAASFWELCLSLLSGAALVVAPAEQLLPGPALCALIDRQQVTQVTLPPSALAALPAEQGLPSMLTGVVGGERCPTDLVTAWSVGRQMINAYGPTEATVCATMSPDPPIRCVCLAGDEDAGAAWAGKMFLLREHRCQFEGAPARCNLLMP